MWDWLAGLFGKKKKQEEIKTPAPKVEPTRSVPVTNKGTLSLQMDTPKVFAPKTEFSTNNAVPSKNFSSLSNLSMPKPKVEQQKPKPVEKSKSSLNPEALKWKAQGVDYVFDNTSDLNLSLANKGRKDGKRYSLGTGNSKIENIAVHEDDVNDIVKQLGDRYHNERNSLGRFWGSFTGETDLQDKNLRRKLIENETKKITDRIGKNPDGTFNRDYTDDEAYRLATLQLASRQINGQPLKAFVPKSTGKEQGFGDRLLATAKTVGNMSGGEDGIASMGGNALLGKQKSDDGFNLLRFAADLPTGIVSGVTGLGSSVTDALSGKRMGDDGSVEDLNTLQRLGSGADAAITVFGLPSGGSGTLLKSVFKSGGKQAAKQGGMQVVKEIGKTLAKDAIKEGIEEGAQQIAQNFSDSSNYDEQGNFKMENIFSGVPEAAGLGALGGGMMSGAGVAISGIKGKVRAKVDSAIDPVQNPVKNAVAMVEADRQIKLSRLSPDQMKYNVAETIGDIKGDTRQRMSKVAFDDLQRARQNSPYYTSDGMGVELSRQGNRKYANPRARALNENFIVKQRLAPRIGEVIGQSSLVDSTQDVKGHGIADAGFDYREVPVKYKGDDYTATIDIAKSKDHGRNTLYEGNIRKASVLPGELIEPGYSTEASSLNLAQTNPNVNTELDNQTQIEQNITQQPEVEIDFKAEDPVQAIRKAYEQYGNDFYDNMTPELQDYYENMLDEQPRTKDGVYQDPITGESWIDETVKKDDGSQTGVEQGDLGRKTEGEIDVDDYINEQIKAQKENTKSGFIQKLRDAKAQLKHQLVDDAVAYEDYMNKAKSKEAKLQKEALRSEIRNDIDNVRASDMIAQQFIRDNGLSELGKLSTKEMNQFQQYLIARRHAADLHKKGIKTGRDLDTDLAIIDKYKSKFAKEEKIYRNFNKKLLQYMEDNGLISKELHKELKKNKAYTPYQRLMDDVNSFTGHSQQPGNLSSEQVIKGMKGSERTILNPIESTMTNTMRIINEGQRNVAARKISEQIFSENRLKEGQKPRSGYDTINFMEDGKKVSYEVPKLVAEEMKGLNRVLPDGADKIVRVLSAPAKTLRGGATSLNPMFAASNLVRDQLQTTVTGNLKANVKGTPQALLATFGFGKKANALRAELSAQGIIGSEYRQTYGYKQGDLMVELQKDHKISKKVADKLKHPIDTLNDIIGRTEYFTRAQQYFGTDGDVVAKSQAARNNTLNFSRGGRAVTILNKIVPFLNAGVQGGRQMTNQFTKRPVRTTVALATFGAMAAAIKGFNEGDEDKKELYDRVSDYEKRTNLILFDDDAKYNVETGRIDGLIKIPIPQFLYPITDGINNIKGEPEDFLKIASNVFEVFTGIDAENPVNQLTPTAIKPFIEAATNTNTFTGRDIVSEYDKEKAPEDKGAKYTTGFARTMAKLTGVDAPIIDNFIQNWAGGLGKDLAKTLTDNPDNTKDGGGVGKMLSEGGYRRFLSAGADSQWQMTTEKGEELKKQLANNPDFKSLSKEDQEKVRKAISQDYSSIGSALGKVERGEELKKDLSRRQQEVLQGLSQQDYIEQILKGSDKVDRERLYNEKDYEYNEFKKEYDKKIKNDEYSTADKIKADKKLKKLEVGKDFDKWTREIYDELGKDDFRKVLENAVNPDEVLEKVLSYGDALVKAGLISKNKFRDKYGNISLSVTTTTKKKSSSGGSGRKPSYKMDTMALISGALKAARSTGELGQLADRKYTRKGSAPKARTVAVKRLSGRVPKK